MRKIKMKCPCCREATLELEEEGRGLFRIHEEGRCHCDRFLARHAAGGAEVYRQQIVDRIEELTG